MRKTIITILTTTITVIAIIIGAIRGEEIYYWMGCGDAEQRINYHVRVAEADFGKYDIGSETITDMITRKTKPKYLWIDGEGDIIKRIAGLSNEDAEQKTDRPLQILHFPYGSYKKMKIDGKLVYDTMVLISTRENTCDTDKRWTTRDGDDHFSRIQDKISRMRRETLQKHYQEVSPCGDWGSMIRVGAEEKKSYEKGVDIDLPHGDKIFQDKTVFVFIRRYSYKEDLTRELKK